MVFAHDNYKNASMSDWRIDGAYSKSMLSLIFKIKNICIY